MIYRWLQVLLQIAGMDKTTSKCYKVFVMTVIVYNFAWFAIFRMLFTAVDIAEAIWYATYIYLYYMTLKLSASGHLDTLYEKSTISSCKKSQSYTAASAAVLLTALGLFWVQGVILSALTGAVGDTSLNEFRIPLPSSPLVIGWITVSRIVQGIVYLQVVLYITIMVYCLRIHVCRTQQLNGACERERVQLEEVDRYVQEGEEVADEDYEQHL